MPRAAQDLTQVTIKIPSDWVEEFDALAEVMAQPGTKMTRTDAMRIALHRGLESLRVEHVDALKEVNK
jgi:hypothetical protein